MGTQTAPGANTRHGILSEREPVFYPKGSPLNCACEALQAVRAAPEASAPTSPG